MSAAVILVVNDKNKMTIHMYNAYEQRLTQIIIHCTHTIYFICVTDSLYFFQDSGPFETRWIFVHSIYWNTIKRNKKIKNKRLHSDGDGEQSLFKPVNISNSSLWMSTMIKYCTHIRNWIVLMTLKTTMNIELIHTYKATTDILNVCQKTSC